MFVRSTTVVSYDRRRNHLNPFFSLRSMTLMDHALSALTQILIMSHRGGHCTVLYISMQKCHQSRRAVAFSGCGAFSLFALL